MTEQPGGDVHGVQRRVQKQLAEIKQSWQTVSVEQQRVMVETLLEPAGLHHYVEQEGIVSLIPHPPFLPWFSEIPEASLLQMGQKIKVMLQQSLKDESQQIHHIALVSF